MVSTTNNNFSSRNFSVEVAGSIKPAFSPNLYIQKKISLGITSSAMQVAIQKLYIYIVNSFCYLNLFTKLYFVPLYTSKSI